MTLTPGTKLGRYEIRSKLGEGGMGEVYLAEDTRLHRKVALKVLPVDLASNQDRMRRFEQEATAAAALNHPHIAHIYEIGSSPTVSEGSGRSDETHFIAMEFIEGETLREKIYRERAPLAKLLKYLHQVAEGLAKAHAAGIVHRDLKPDNIMITRDDYAKILDFGLAKLIEPQRTFGPGETGSSEIATAVMPQQSIPGMVMGTLGYMSPEQATGRVKEIDQRSDIFSYGCILYEAATGQKAFAGKDVLDSLHKIVHAPTPQIKDFRPDAPDDLQRIIRRCLAKDPEERYHSIKDVAIELEEVRRELADRPLTDTTAPSREVSKASAEDLSGQAAAATTNVPPGSLSTHQSSAEYLISGITNHRTAAAFVALAVVVGIVAIGYALYRLEVPKRAGISLQSAKYMRLTTSGKAAGAAISPDGKYVVYVIDDSGQRSLWLQHIPTGSNTPIAQPDKGVYGSLAFSPDGSYVFYAKADSPDLPATLYQLPVLGGAARKSIPNFDGEFTLSPGGERVAFIRTDQEGSALVTANADGSGAQKLASRKWPEVFGSPAWSPDGKVIACWVGVMNTRAPSATIVVLQLDTGTQRSISQQKKWVTGGEPIRLAWLSDGKELLVTGRETWAASSPIWSVSYPQGEVRRITNDLNDYLTASLTADSKGLVTVQNEGATSLWILPARDPARGRQVTSGKERYFVVSWTPDGRIVYPSGRSGNRDIWIMNADGTNRKQLTANAGTNLNPTVSPDGRYIIFDSDRTDSLHLWRMNIDGSNPMQVTYGAAEYGRASFSPDGRWVVYEVSEAGLGSVWKVSIDGGTPVQVTNRQSSTPEISPDGKFLASADVSTRKIVVMPFDGGEPVHVFDLPQTASDQLLRWTPDGQNLAFLKDINGVTNIWIQPLAGGAPKQFTDFTSDRINYFDWSRDGKQIVCSRAVENNDVVLISDIK